MVIATDNIREDARLQEVTKRITAAFNPYRIILFGSRARGNAKPDSDYDLFIEMESDKRPAERMSDISRLFGLREWGLDAIIYTPDEVKRKRTMKGMILEEIEREGVVLYEKS